ncbi:MATE family efflux transporter [Blastococcus saxobsidens]|uniref:Putative MATE family efflux protein n=1 Tax=Blastococcus saxobsidens TaxID=138336 RepID=A0A4Q7Y7W0_9ACTN|nr:MATE family efflux transporter [Blastococcus saxobsidens]RZU32664.1 putative MATE family efflux protein [Blastococcus saxobsidens]
MIGESRRPPGSAAPRPAPPGVLALALPALVVLAAEPLYLLVDTAVVGNLGTVALGGLAVGGGLLAWAAALLNFLAYGTTARAARRAGAGDRAGAVTEGVQATWLAVALGLLVLLLFQLLAGPLTRALAGGAGPVAEAGEQWLRVAALGAPLLLVSLAGNGWLRGVQELRRPVRYVVAGSLLSLVLCPVLVHPAGLGLVGSAVANVVGQALTAALFVRALLREDAGWRVHPTALARQLVVGRDLLLRAAVLQISFLVAAGVAARAGTAALGAHQIALQLFFFLALVLDAYAIAAQTLVGHALGGQRPDEARATARRVAVWGLGTGCAVAAVLLALRDVLPPLFTDDPAVLAQAAVVWWFLAGFQPLAGVVFALDGVLMGAGDVGYLRTVTIASALVGFLPLSLLSGPLDLGLAGVWTGLTLFVVLRLVAVLVRVVGDRWLGTPETVAP